MSLDAHTETPAVAVPKLVIGVCTRHRPGMLDSLLGSLMHMHRPEGVDLVVHVVENDSVPASQALVAAYDARAAFTFSYELEPRIGIPQARNRLLRRAQSLAATALIFVDDDEEVGPDWLLAMHRYAQQTGWQAVLQGRVMSRFEPGCEDYLRPYFQRKIRQTGDRLTSCASNNTLVPLALLPEHGAHSFDESRPRDGGTDTIFFSGLARQGVALLYCREAAVEEIIPRARANLRYLSQRKFRVGLLLGSGVLKGKPRNAGRALFYALRSLLSALQAALLILLLQRDAAIRAWLSSCRSFGCAAAYFRVRQQPYQEVEGF